MLVSVEGLKFKIRKCTNEDYKFFYNLTKRNMFFYINKHLSWDVKEIRNDFILGERDIRIIERNNKRIGFYHVVFEDGLCYIKNIQISPSLQGKGLGTFLMKLIEEEVGKHKFKKIRLTVFKDNPVNHFYQRIGYKKIKDKKHSWVLEKEL